MAVVAVLRDWSSQGRKSGARWWATVTLQGRDGGGLQLGNGYRGDGKWLDSGFIWRGWMWGVRFSKDFGLKEWYRWWFGSVFPRISEHLSMLWEALVDSSEQGCPTCSSHMQPRMAMNAAQHKMVNLL